MVAGFPVTLAQALATLTSAFNGQSGTSAITNCSVMVVNLPSNSTFVASSGYFNSGGSEKVLNPQQAGKFSLIHFRQIAACHINYLLSVYRDNSTLKVLPCFLRRRGGNRAVCSKPKKEKVIKQWDRDVLCLSKNAQAWD